MPYFKKQFALLLSCFLILSGCSPTNSINPLTGDAGAAAAGGAVGAGIFAMAGAPKSIIALAGVGGASLGYYLTTLRFSSRGIVAAGGQVYALGNYVVIDLPTDNLFDANTADFLPNTEPELQSIAAVLNRYPDYNIIISGNTSGSWTRRFEKAMSICRAQQIAAYLWSQGFGAGAMGRNTRSPKYIYVGYGNTLPIANRIHIESIRQNSHVQIIAYRKNTSMQLCKKRCYMEKFDGKVQDLEALAEAMERDKDKYDNYGTTAPEGSLGLAYNGQVDSTIPELEADHVAADTL